MDHFAFYCVGRISSLYGIYDVSAMFILKLYLIILRLYQVTDFLVTIYLLQQDLAKLKKNLFLLLN